MDAAVRSAALLSTVTRRLAALFVSATLVLAFVLPAAARFVVPPLTGHVVDPIGALRPAEAAGLEQRLEAVRRESGFEIVVFLPASLDGAPVEDVAYEAFNTWKLGQEKADNGVLLVVAAKERRLRIETGRGVGGALTDVQSAEILRQMAPLLQEDRVRDALELGTTAITRALVTGTVPEERSPPAAPEVSFLQLALTVGIGLLVLVLAIVSPAFRSLLFFLLLFGRRGGGRGGGGGYSGGGGSSGGGGASGSY